MKSKILIIIICLFFILGMIILSKYLNNINKTQVNNIEENKEEDKSMEIVTVTSKNFEEEVLNSEKPVIIDFYADWCGPCKSYAPIVEAVASENSDIKVVKVNVDNAQDIAMNYNVMSIPTTVIIKNGKEVNRAVGMISKSALLELVK